MVCSLSICNSENISIPPQLLRVFIDRKDIEILYKEKQNKYSSIFYLSMEEDIYNYLVIKKETTQYEENNKPLSIFGNESISKW